MVIQKNNFSIIIYCFLLAGCFSGNPIPRIKQEVTLTKNTLPVKGFIAGTTPPFKECHASTILKLHNGQFIAAWFAGTKEKNDDVGIWMSKGEAGIWSAPQKIAKINNDPHWNPVLFESPEGKIFLFFKTGKTEEIWQTWVRTSYDEGETWSAAYELVKNDKGGRGPVRSKPIILSDGSWLAGASHELGGFHVFVDKSTDKGKTWVATPYLALGEKQLKNKELIQPTLWESSPGKVHMLIRSAIGSICRSNSDDYGKTWSPVYKTDLPNPNSGIDIVKLRDGTLVLAYNPDNKNYGSRAPLLLGLSYDNGKTWPKQLIIENGKGEDEFSYPALINFGDTLAVSYTWQRKNIAFWMGTVKDITDAGTFSK